MARAFLRAQIRWKTLTSSTFHRDTLVRCWLKIARPFDVSLQTGLRECGRNDRETRRTFAPSTVRVVVVRFSESLIVLDRRSK